MKTVGNSGLEAIKHVKEHVIDMQIMWVSNYRYQIDKCITVFKKNLFFIVSLSLSSMTVMMTLSAQLTEEKCLHAVILDRDV